MRHAPRPEHGGYGSHDWPRVDPDNRACGEAEPRSPVVTFEAIANAVRIALGDMKAATSARLAPGDYTASLRLHPDFGPCAGASLLFYTVHLHATRDGTVYVIERDSECSE